MKKFQKIFTRVFTLLLFTISHHINAQHTFSIVAVDPATGEIGSAGATCLDIDDLNGEEGALVIADIILGIGAINTQAFWSPVNQAAARERMEMGDSPQEILDWLEINDPAPGNAASRQYGVVDLIGGPGGTPRSAAFTGDTNSPVANHITGPNYAIQGNILISQAVLDDMETGFLNTTGSLADKLMGAMQGAKRVGADNRCTGNQTSSKSAFLRVANVLDEFTNYGHLTTDLNVSKTAFAEDPIDVLQTTYDFYLANPGTNCTETVSTFPYQESFETGLGQWTQNDIDVSHVGNTDFDWTRTSGATETSNTGPTGAVNGDFYLYTEASGSNVGFPTKRATLDSPCFDLSSISAPFLSFRYHLFGSNVGNLAVRVNDGSGWNTIWLEQGNQGDIWNAANIDLSAYENQTIQIRMDSETGLGQRSDIAIDAISIQSQPLGIQEFLDASIAISPNPTKDVVQISSSEITITQISVYDISGKLLMQPSTNISEVNSVSLAHVPAGLYFLDITTTEGTIVKRVLRE